MSTLKTSLNSNSLNYFFPADEKAGSNRFTSIESGTDTEEDSFSFNSPVQKIRNLRG